MVIEFTFFPVYCDSECQDCVKEQFEEEYCIRTLADPESDPNGEFLITCSAEFYLVKTKAGRTSNSTLSNATTTITGITLPLNPRGNNFQDLSNLEICFVLPPECLPEDFVLAVPGEFPGAVAVPVVAPAPAPAPAPLTEAPTIMTEAPTTGTEAPLPIVKNDDGAPTPVVVKNVPPGQLKWNLDGPGIRRRRLLENNNQLLRGGRADG